MRAWILVIIFTVGFDVFASEEPILNSIADLKWKNRIVLVNLVENKKEAISELESNVEEINDRDIIWLVMGENQMATNYSGKLSDNFLSSIRLKYPLDQRGVLLIGKDGGIKADLGILDLSSIFKKIDAMPMRQYELSN